MSETPHCKACDQIGHTPFNCPRRPRPPLKPSKGFRKSGKYGNKWKLTRKRWLILNPPNHEGYYFCYIDGKPVSKEEVELDHVESRTRRPDLRYTLSNIRPICHYHNQDKGSLSLSEYFGKLKIDRGDPEKSTATGSQHFD